MEKEIPEANKSSEKGQFSYFKAFSNLALIFFIGFSFYLLISTLVLIFLTKPDSEIKVPDVVGKQFTEVYNSLSRKGFKPELSFYDVFDVEDGVIIRQYPESGSIVADGSSIKLEVSRSNLFLDVPSLTGVELPFAVNKLKNLHIHNRKVSIGVGVVSYIPSEKNADNIVIDQNPKAGERITPDRKVNLLVSAGKIEPDSKMPGVIDQTIDLCFDLLLAKGLNIEVDTVKTAEKEKSGIVTSQNPAKDAVVKKGDTVKLQVNYFPLDNHPYSAFEVFNYTIPDDEEKGIYEAYIEDNSPRRLRFTQSMNPGQKISFIFHRTGNAKISILCNKKILKVFGIDVDD